MTAGGALERTRIVWRRTGKEHGEHTGFQLNPPDVVAASLQRKVEGFDTVDPDTWSWWRVDDTLLIEWNRPGDDWPRSEQVLYYYLPERHLMVVENAYNERVGPDWCWYVHIGDLDWDDPLGAYVFTDLFVDVLVHRDNRQHTVVDLDDLAQAHELGILDDTQVAATLRHTQALIDDLVAGDFPPVEIRPWRQKLVDQGLFPDASTPSDGDSP